MSQVLYASPIDLRNSMGDIELAQVASPPTAPTVSTALLATAILSANTPPSSDPNVTTAYNNIVAALTTASALIDSRLRVRYTLPLTVVPLVLTEYGVALARFNLNEKGASDEIRYRYEAAKADLAAVANDKIDIGAVGTNTTGVVSIGPNFLSSAPVRDNTYDTLCGFGNITPGGAFNAPGCCR